MGQILASLATLTAMEIVLGIDNIVFLSVLTGKLPEHQRAPARQLGLGAALVTRLLLLLGLTWLMGLTAPLFTVLKVEISGRDLILLAGGLFLIAKATHEIHAKLEGPSDEAGGPPPASFAMVVAQIGLVDIVFSLDSVITAVGMAQQLWVMILAVVLSMVVMLFSAGAVAGFVERHPSVKMLALSFLILIGVTLVAEAIDHHIARGYVYFAMCFSLLVEMLNLRARKVAPPPPVALHEPHLPRRPEPDARTMGA